MPRVLFLAAHRPNRSPSQRYRFEQYFSFLEENGFSCELSYIIDEAADKIFYSAGNFSGKLAILKQAIKKRREDKRRYDEFDIVFVQREAIMIGSTYFERKIKSSKAKFVFDFDDSIWMMDTSEGNKKWEWLKKPEKTSEIIAYADIVFAGNSYLARFAKQYNSNVVLIPTTVDTGKFVANHSLRHKEKLVIGWSGSITTIKHFNSAIEFLREIKNRFGNTVEFRVMGDETYENEELGVKGIKWSAEDEISILNSFDIGIMPLPDDKWAKGKCGLKGLTYMALEIPTIMSPVGVNTEIISDGVNGFLASSASEWIEKIALLLSDASLRKRVGEEGRKTVVGKYSVESQKNNYLVNFLSLLK